MFLLIPIAMAAISYFANDASKDWDFEIPEREIDKFDVNNDTADKPIAVAGAY